MIISNQLHIITNILNRCKETNPLLNLSNKPNKLKELMKTLILHLITTLFNKNQQAKILLLKITQLKMMKSWEIAHL